MHQHPPQTGIVLTLLKKRPIGELGVDGASPYPELPLNASKIVRTSFLSVFTMA